MRPLPSADAMALLRELADADAGQGVLMHADSTTDELLVALSTAFAIDVHRALGSPGWHVYVTRTGLSMLTNASNPGMDAGPLVT